MYFGHLGLICSVKRGLFTDGERYHRRAALWYSIGTFTVLIRTKMPRMYMYTTGKLVWVHPNECPCDGLKEKGIKRNKTNHACDVTRRLCFNQRSSIFQHSVKSCICLNGEKLGNAIQKLAHLHPGNK